MGIRSASQKQRRAQRLLREKRPDLNLVYRYRAWCIGELRFDTLNDVLRYVMRLSAEKDS